MADQSFLARLGLRLGILGSAATLAIAAPDADGNYNDDCRTNGTRLGIYFDRTPAANAIGFVNNGNVIFQIGESTPIAPGLQLTPVAVNPGDAQTLWSNSGDSNALYYGASPLGGGVSFPLLAPDDTIGAPSYSWTSSPTNGMYRVSAAAIGFAIGGTARLSVSTAGAAVIGAFSATTTITATTAFRSDPGSNTVPGYGFTGETNTGMYRSAAGTLSFTSLGTQTLNLTSTAVSPLFPVLGVTGTAAAPGFATAGDPNTGIYGHAADALGLSAGGTGRFIVRTTYLEGTVPFATTFGTAAAPAFSYASEQTTGMYRSAANTIGFSTSSTLRLSISTTEITAALALNMGGFSLTNYTIGTVTVAGTALTLQASNASTYAGRYVIFTSGSGCTVSINNDLPAGFNMVFEQNAAGTVTFAAGTGTVVNRQSFLSTAGQYAIGSLVCRTTGNAVLAGDLA